MADSTTDQKRPVWIEWEDDVGQSVIFDAMVTENHSGNSEITDHPVETGSDFTDHIRRMPEEIGLTGVVTDDPLVVERSVNAEAASTGGDPDQRANSAYLWLIQAKDQAKLLRVYTKLRTYRNMVIMSINVTRDRVESRIVRVDLQLREILIAVTEQVEAPEPALTAAPARRRKRKQGKRTKQKETDANKEKGLQSWAAGGGRGEALSDFLSAGPFG